MARESTITQGQVNAVADTIRAGGKCPAKENEGVAVRLAVGDEVYVIHPVDMLHLKMVTEDMIRLGAPKIRIVRHSMGFWVALEGCHRMRAAHDLGTDVIWHQVDRDARLAVGFDGVNGAIELSTKTRLYLECVIGPGADDCYSAGDLAEALISPGGCAFSVAENGKLVMLGDHDYSDDDDCSLVG